MQSLSDIKQKFDDELSSSRSLQELESLKIKYLGRNGFVNALLGEIKDIPNDRRKDFGSKVNELKSKITGSLERRQSEFMRQDDDVQRVDITLPGKQYPHGTLHPVTYAIEEISAIFEKIGFIRMSYPEVEWEHYSFETLNMPKGHPARDDFETFYIDAPEHRLYAKMVLTPHTSSGQVREMIRIQKPPIRMINIAKCYRRNWDATHAPMFYQFEGLCVDRGINITHLKGTIDYFAKAFFGPEREIRLRPHHFQFTEPSFETDISCNICNGTGTINGKKCRVCKSGWLELGGSGMVHPNVLHAGGIDPDEYTGWAFGFGPERCLMMKLGLAEIRDLYGGDIRFLEQF